MADSESMPKPNRTKKKRKLKGPDADRRPAKKQRFDFPEKPEDKKAKEEHVIRKSEEGRQWGNLQLILLLQKKDILLQELVSLTISCLC